MTTAATTLNQRFRYLKLNQGSSITVTANPNQKKCRIFEMCTVYASR